MASSFLARLDEVQKSLCTTPASASTFTLKFFNGLYFPNHVMDLVHIWYDNRYRFQYILPWPIGHIGSKTRSLGQILVKP